MRAQELRIGNWVKLVDNYYSKENLETLEFQVTGFNGDEIVHWRIPSVYGGRVCSGSYIEKDIEPIPLTEERLIKFGFEPIANLVTGTQYQISIGRDRFISISGLGTGNEFVFLSDERGGKVNDVIVARNYDYDGTTYVHHIQNLFHSLTGEEL
jgi:hypothetical protein